MLRLIRTKQKTFIVRIVFWVIIAAFVGTVFLVWGRGGERGPTGGAAALQINGTVISYEEYQSAYSNLYNLYRGIYRESFTQQLEDQLNLPQQAIDQLIEQALMMQEAERVGLVISENELIASIAAYPSFQDNGKFSRERYIQVLNYERLSPEQFEASQRRQLLVDKLREQLQQGISITPEEIDEDYRKQNDKINLNFVRLLPASFENKVKVDDEALQSFFDAQQEDFRQPERVSLRYLKFEASRYENEIGNFRDEELNRYYRRNLDQFEIKEQAKASHILIKVDQTADDTQKEVRRSFAASILQQLNEGGDFSTLARANSDDPGSATKGGDLGYFGRGAMVTPFDTAVFAMNPGDISDIVETDFGYHIIKLEEYIEAGVNSLAEVLDEVKNGLKAEKARQLAYEKAMDAYNINRKTGDLEAAAKSNDLVIKETGLFDRSDAIDAIGREADISAAAFSLVSGGLARPVQIPQGVFLFSIKEREQSRIPELKEVQSPVETAYRKAQAVALAEKTADKLLKDTLDKKSLKTAAKADKLQVEETGLFSSSYGAFVPRIGSSQELADAAFALNSEKPLGQVVFKQDDSNVLISLKETEKADMANLDSAERIKIEERLLTQKKAAAINDVLKGLRDSAQISFDPTLINELARR